jgi:Tfp pilus assembly protein FimT
MAPRKERITQRMVCRWFLARPTSRASRRGALQSGSTVAELLATVSVLGTFIGTTMLTTARVRPTYMVRGATRQVAADLYKARMAALTENNRYLVQFTDSHTDTILDDNNNDGTAQTGETLKTSDMQRDWPGVTMSSTGAITFLPDGTVSTPVTVTVQKYGANDKTITVSQAGSIRVQ